MIEFSFGANNTEFFSNLSASKNCEDPKNELENFQNIFSPSKTKKSPSYNESSFDKDEEKTEPPLSLYKNNFNSMKQFNKENNFVINKVEKLQPLLNNEKSDPYQQELAKGILESNLKKLQSDKGIRNDFGPHRMSLKVKEKAHLLEFHLHSLEGNSLYDINQHSKEIVLTKPIIDGKSKPSRKDIGMLI
jgi:hypothetical protein